MPTLPGLCATCRHARVVAGARSEFWMCRRSIADPSFPRYPALPVTACHGHEPGTPAGPDASPPTTRLSPAPPAPDEC